MRFLSSRPWLLLLLLLAAPGLANPLSPPPPPPLVVHFFDVGQGDAALIVSPAGKTILIDGGPPEAGPSLAARVDALMEGPLDLVVLSHPHLDHLGGLTAVLDRVGAKRFLEPDFDHPTVAFAELRERVNALHIPRQLARFPTLEEERRQNPSGADARHAANARKLLEIGLGGGAVLELHWPRLHAEPFLRDTRSDPNANSIVARLRYGETAFLFTGDAEEDTERKIARQGHPLRSQVLKVARHGSRHSTTYELLKAVRPELAVISAARHNDYGHPHAETLRRLEKVGARVLLTATDGEIVVESDGKRISTRHRSPRPPDAGITPDARTETGRERATPPSLPSTSSAEETAPFVASERSDVFHLSSCENARKIRPKNRRTFPDRDAAARGRRPAKDCNP